MCPDIVKNRHIVIFTNNATGFASLVIGDEMDLTRKIYFVIQMILLVLFNLNGQNNLRFENYNIEDGLPHNRTHFVYQDTVGWIWIGSEGGISRFDGTSFKTYLTGNSSEEGPLSRTSCVWEDTDSRLWFGSLDNGLFLYNRSMERFDNFKSNDTCSNCISSNQVLSITSDSSGIMWIATNRGLNRYDPVSDSFRWFQRDKNNNSSLSSDTIQEVFIDRDNRLWLGTFRGLDYLNLKSGQIANYSLTQENQSAPINGYRIEDIKQDERGNILVATYLNGLFIIDPSLEMLKNILPDPNYKRSYTVNSVLPEQNGKLWLGTRGGVYLLNQDYKVINHYVCSLHDQKSLGHNSIRDIHKDKAGDIWFATRNGVSHANLRTLAFQYYGASTEDNNYLNDPEVYSICQSKDGNIWLGTESGGVNILDKKSGKFTYLTHDEHNTNTICSNCIKAIIQDSKNNFWIGTFLGGLDYYDVKQKSFTHYVNDPKNENSLSNNTIWAIHEDRKGNIWIGTEVGLDRFDPRKKRFCHYKIGLKCQSVHVIYEDSTGNLFFGSNLGCLTVMKSDSRLIEFEVSARVIFEDSQGRIWIGSDGYGDLMQFSIQQGVVKSYKTSDGLPTNLVYGILEDDNANLWLSTGKGLSKFDPEKELFKTYKADDGIQSDRFYYGSYFKNNSGELLFGGQNGLTVFDPDQLSDNQYIPPVVITDFKIFNKKVLIGVEFEGKKILEKSISESKEIIVDYKHSVLTFDYVALNYLNSPKNEYAYILEGFEKEWNYVGSNRSATYTNLDPGSYIFRVKGSNNSGLWNEKGVSLKIIVVPPFSQTLFFKLLMFVLTSFMIYFTILIFIKREKLKNQLMLERLKSKEQHKINMMKFQFFTNISHEIRTPIALIVSPLTRIKNMSLSKEQILNDIEVVHRNAMRLGKLVDQLLDYRKLEAGKLKLELSRGNIVAFLENVIYMFKEMSTEKEVELNFFSALDQAQIYFDSDKIEKVMFNLLSNAFKHTPEGGSINVTVSLTYMMNKDIEPDELCGSGEYVQIVVRDNGSGIEESKREQIFDRFYQAKSYNKDAISGSGIGLSLSKELIKIHNGRIILKSKVGIGTEITILIPAIKSDPEKNDQHDAQIVNDQPSADLSNTTDKKSLGQKNDRPNPVILILEDNKELLNFIKSIFKEDYSVLVAEDGKLGLELARETIPDVVISDIMMPKLDGIKLCEKLKHDFRTSHIPILLLTALSSNQHKKEGILGGADEYITKPFDPSLLKIKVDHLLATRRLLKDKYIRDYLLQPKSISNETSSPDEKFLTKLVSVIENNISDPAFGITKISKEVGVSRTQLYRKLDALTEMTVKEFIRSVRLKKAAQFIIQDHLRISEVAYSVGFLKVAYFRKCFKEMYSMTPSEYAKRNANKY